MSHRARTSATTLLLSAGLLATTTGMAPAAAATPATPATPPLVFTSDRDGDTEIYTRGVAGSPSKLTNNRFEDYGAVWSPDGARLAFVSTRDGDPEVFVMGADGRGVRQLTHNSTTADGAPISDSAPAWSPDGTALAFASTRDGGEPEIYRMKADGTQQVRLTTTEQWVSDHTPSWSPDGAHLVFSSNRDGFENYEVFRMRADGSQLTRLTSTPDGVDSNAPEYSPDGSRIAFSSTRSGGQQDLFTMRADGTDVQHVVGNPDMDEVFPHWTSDGSRLVFQSFAGPVSPSEDLWVVSRDGSGLRRVASSGRGESAPDPRPAG